MEPPAASLHLMGDRMHWGCTRRIILVGQLTGVSIAKSREARVPIAGDATAQVSHGTVLSTSL